MFCSVIPTCSARVFAPHLAAGKHDVEIDDDGHCSDETLVFFFDSRSEHHHMPHHEQQTGHHQQHQLIRYRS